MEGPGERLHFQRHRGKPWGSGPAPDIRVPRVKSDLSWSAGPAGHVQAVPGDAGWPQRVWPARFPPRWEVGLQGGARGRQGASAGLTKAPRSPGQACTMDTSALPSHSHPTSCDGTSHLDPEIKPTPQIPSGPLCSWGLMEHSGLFVSQKITFVPGMGKKKIIPSAGAQLCRALATGCVVTVSFRGSPTSKWA